MERWSETQNIQTDEFGRFSVLLGSVETLNQSKFSDTSLWLQIQILPDDPMQPRTRLVAVPFAIRAGGAWSLKGNYDPDDQNYFVGTLDGKPLRFRVNDAEVMKIYPPMGLPDPQGDESPRIVAGHSDNTIADSADGAVIAGGGYIFMEDRTNEITHNFGVISGGAGNQVLNYYGVVGGGKLNSAEGEYSTVPGGNDCRAVGMYSFAAGYRARAMHDGSFVFADATEEDFTSGGENRFRIRATGGTIISGADGGDLRIKDASEVTTIRLDGGDSEVEIGVDNAGNLLVSGPLGSPAIQIDGSTSAIGMEDLNNGVQTIKLDGNAGNIKLFRNAVPSAESIRISEDGSIELYEDGVIKLFKSGEGSSTIRLNAATGYITTEALKLTGGIDLAEPFQHTGDNQLPEGALVIIDDENPGKIKISRQSYDSRVAGIVSGAGNVNPGITLTQNDIQAEGQNVALAGRVYCLATAANGPIKPGDMLTTSDLPGHAMKATDRNLSFGAVIGKAMSSLEDGEGLVFVLVNLQ